MGAINPPGIEARDTLGNRKRSGKWTFEAGIGFSGKQFRVDGANAKIILESAAAGTNLSSMTLDGVTGQYLKTGSAYSFGQVYTHEIWIKLLADFGGTKYLSDFNNGGQDHRLQIIPQASGYKLQLAVAGGTSLLSTTLLNINIWYHIVNRAAAGLKEVFIGTQSLLDTLEISFPNTASMPISSLLYDGTHGQVITPIAMKMDDRRLWNTTRDLADINNFRSVQLSGAEPGLASYVQLNDGITFTSSPQAVADLVVPNITNAIGFVRVNPFNADVPF